MRNSHPTRPVNEATQILQDADEGLRSLMQQALAAGNYAEVAEIAQLADGVAQILRGVGTDVTSVTPTLARPILAVSENTRADNSQSAVMTKEARDGVRKFPRFERQVDRLVKIGWSKKDRRPYEHKAPKDLIDPVRAALLKVADKKGDFGTEQVIPMVGPDGKDIPSYQVYLILAWFRSLRLVEKSGRDGYRLDRTAMSAFSLESAWELLTRKEL